ncbi:MAG: MBL fold metallo-hydrolase [Deltaproteobacteria bacterium]|nr:MBL fold metallo-hydrolase [Deltaproteobacteria bacterium]
MTAITEQDRAPHDPFEVIPGIRVVPLRTPTLPPATHTNCVVLGHERVVLVDPASPYPEEQARLQGWIAEEGLTVHAVWLTHHHLDHVGGANAAKEAFDVPVCAHPATAQRLEGAVPIDVELFEGDSPNAVHDIDIGLDVRALHTPGHARGHLAFREEVSRIIVAGDLVAGQGTIVIDPPEGDMGDYLATLARLITEGCGTLIPSHGGAIAAGEEKLLEYIAHRKMREDQLLAALAKREGRPLDLVPILYPEVPTMFHPLASRQILAHLLKLESEGQVERPDGSSGVPGSPIYLSADMAGWTAVLPVFRLR